MSFSETSYKFTHEMKVQTKVNSLSIVPTIQYARHRLPQLVHFYMLAPLRTVSLMTSEAWCLLTNDLTALYIVVALILSIFV